MKPRRQAFASLPFSIVLALMVCVSPALTLCAVTASDGSGPLPANRGVRQAVPFETLQKDFANPDMIYAPFIFWFWDEPLDAAKMAEMSRMLCSQGFNPGYAHARKSMVGTPDLPAADWLGEKWFKAFGAALAEAEARHAYLGYCDEYWWPSFQAYGRVLEASPELQAKSLRWETLDIQGGAEVRVPASFFSVAAQLDQPIPPAQKPGPRMGKWIWNPGGSEAAHTCLFRRSFTLPAGRRVKSAEARVIVDDAYALYLNGRKVGEGDNWQKPGFYDLGRALVAGENLVAVEGRNVAGSFGLLFGLAIVLDDGQVIEVVSDKEWGTSLSAAQGWQAPGFKAAGWVPALEIADAGGGPWRYIVDRIEHVPAVIRSRTLKVIGAGEPFAWTAPAGGAWRVYAFSLYSHPGADGSPVNYIDSRLAPLFIRLALEPYAQRYPDRLGRSIPGDFIDNEGDYGWGLAWSGTLDERYRKRYGRDIRLWMPLAVDRDAEGVFARARWEWFDLVSDIYAETFQAVTDWHERRGMSTTAHFWEEGIPAQLNAVGDHLKLLRTLTMPGQDCLGGKALRVHDFKEIESVAEFGDRRAATELMGAGSFDGPPWGTFNPAFLKQAANAVTAWGMSHIIPHGVFTTRKLEGNPWPPDWYTESPMFPYMRLWTDFVRRASQVNSMGRAVPDVLLYNPMESAWVQADANMLDVEMWSFSEDKAAGRRINAIERAYARVIDDLTAARVEFLVGDRFYLKRMEVGDGRLVLGDFKFRTLVLPPLDILQLETARKILEFAKAGGHVYALGELPSASAEQGMADPRMKTLMEALRAQPTFKACPEQGLKPMLDQPAAGLETPVRFASGGFPMLQHRRRIDGRDFFWLVNNTGQWQASEFAVRDARGAASIWDCETGGIRPAASTETDEGSLLSLVFKPYGAFWLVFDPMQKPHSGPPARLPELETILAVQGPWRVSYDPKVQPVMEYPSTPPAPFKAGVIKPLEDWKAWGLQKFSGLLDYATTIIVDKPEKGMRLDLGNVAHSAEVWVNGSSCGVRLWAPHEYPVGAALRPGKNEVRVRVANLINNSYGDFAESGLLGPVRIVRDKRP
jgi:hypothetical protein